MLSAEALRQTLWPWLVGLLFLFAAFHPVLLHPRQLPLIGGANEGTRQVFPVYEQIHRAGGPVLWDPHLFSGHPLYANSQLAPLYPPTWMVAMLLPPATCYGVLMFLHLAWGLAGWYLLLRALGVNSMLAVGGSAILARQVLFVSQQFAYPLCWWPWVWLLARLVLFGSRNQCRLYALLGSMALAMMVISGHPQIIAYALVISAVILLGEWLVEWWQSRKQVSSPGAVGGLSAVRWLYLLVGCLFALLLSAVQVLPLLELSGNSHRVAMLSNWFATKSPLVENTEIFGGMEMIFGAWQSPLLFFWTGSLIALVWAGERRGILCMSVLVVFCALYALGDITPVIFMVQKLVPLLDRFRNPHQIITHMQCLVIILGCIGWQGLEREAGMRTVRRGWWRMALVVFVLAAVWLLCAHGRNQALALGRLLYGILSRGAGFDERLPQILHALDVVRDGCAYGAVLLGVAGMAGVLAMTGHIFAFYGTRVVLAGIICWAAVSAPVMVRPVSEMMPHNRLVQWLQPRLNAPGGPYRVLNLRVAFTRIVEQPMAVHYGIRVADGMDPLIPMHYWKSWLKAVDYEKEPYPSTKLPVCNLSPDQIRDLDVLRKWNVKYVLSTVAGEREGLKLVRHFTDLPTFKFNLGCGIYPDVYVYELDPPPPGFLHLTTADTSAGMSVPGIAAVVDSGDEIRVRVKVDDSAVLVLSTDDDPAWRVSVDGAQTRKLSYNNEMPAVRIGSGEHEVRFFVAPASLEYGLLLSAVGVVAWLGLVLVHIRSWWRSRSSPR